MFFTGDRARASPRPGRAGSEPSGRTGRRAAPGPKRIIYIAAVGDCPAAGPVVCANSLGVASPSQISGVQHPALMIFMVVIGGTGTVEGPVIGALVCFLLDTYFAESGVWYLVVIGAAAIAVSLPRGLWGTLEA
ncbi:hypothetical protein ACIBAH_22760 [Streptomyces sp. NPDC051445]|uniref:hypothetical protein n=1 Tax=Streptomyces sp. NPDC051445 TaxID=3365653 RepID=UPI0037B20AB4